MRRTMQLISVRIPTRTLRHIDALAARSEQLRLPTDPTEPPPPWSRSEVIRLAVRTGLDTLTQAPPLTL